VPVLRRARGPHAAGDAHRRGALAGSGRPEPLPGVRASRGRRPRPGARPLARRARRRPGRTRCGGVAAATGGRARGLPPRARQRGQSRGREPRPLTLAARLASRSAPCAEDGTRRAGSRQRRPRARRARRDVPASCARPVRAPDRAGRAGTRRLDERAAPRGAATPRGSPSPSPRRLRGSRPGERVAPHGQPLAPRGLPPPDRPRRHRAGRGDLRQHGRAGGRSRRASPGSVAASRRPTRTRALQQRTKRSFFL